MIALITTLIIFLTVPLAFYQSVLPNQIQPDATTSITSEDPCITPESGEATPPPSSNEDTPPSTDNPPSDNTQNDTGDTGSNDSNDTEHDNSNNDEIDDGEHTNTNNPDKNNDTTHPKPTKFKVKTPKNLDKKIQKKVRQGFKNNKTTPTPTPKRPIIQFPQFPEGFPFNKKTPTPTEKLRPTSPVEDIIGNEPMIKTPNTNKQQNKATKELNVPNAKEIQKNVKEKMKSNNTRIQSDPCAPEDTDNTSEKTLYFKVKTVANVGTTSKIVVGATVRILQDDELIETLTSNEDGWAITRLPLGTYMIEVLDPDYKPAYQEVLIAQNEQVTQGGIKIILEPQSQQSSNQQPDTATFSVVISVDGNGSDLPLAGTVITIIQDGKNLKSCTVESVSCNFYLPRGTYIANVSSRYYQPASVTFTVVGEQSKNPSRYFETVFIPLNLYDAKNPSPKQAVGPSSANADVIQYNTILDCFGRDTSAKKCNAKQKKLADLNKDGKIDQKDYNIFLYEIRIR